MKPLTFQTSAPFTLGVELELQLIDPISLDLSPKAPELLKKTPAHLTNNIKPEFIRSMIEICTNVCQDVNQVAEELSSLYRFTEGLAEECGAVMYAASLHPFALVRDRHISDGIRYSEIMADIQMTGRRLITQALHVHVGLTSAESVVRVCDTIRPYLPIFLALSTSSPFFEQEDSGFYSYRTNLFKAMPRSGIPETIGSWQKFQEQITILNEGSLLNGIKELWWDVRPHPDFGTIEIRICDLPSRFDHIMAIVSLIQALVIFLSKEEHPLPKFREVMLNNKWHASRYGLEGTFMDQQPGNHISFAKAATELCALLTPVAKEHGAASFLSAVSDIVQNGSSAHFQKKRFKETGEFTTVINELRQGFWS